jgi:YVTN family beta-propeller protein
MAKYKSLFLSCFWISLIGYSTLTKSQAIWGPEVKKPKDFKSWEIGPAKSSLSPAARDARQTATYHPLLLPNGWSLSPVGRFYALGDLPLNLVVSPSQKYLGILNSGQSTQSIQIFSVALQKKVSEIEIPKSWYGLAFNQAENQVYASGGNDNMIRIYSFNQAKLKLADSIVLGKPWPKEKICPTGIAVNNARKLLYAVTKEDSSLYFLDLNSKTILNKIKLPAACFSCKFDETHQKLYISLWGGKSLVVFDALSGALTDFIPVGDHPNDFILNKAGNRLFVTNANDNTVSIIDLQKKEVVETLNTTLYPTLLSGSTPDGIALSGDEKTLYIANADNNCLSVFDISKPGASLSRGFIPTGWYPTQVKIIGNKIYVTNGKGLHSLANPEGPNPLRKPKLDAQHASYNPKTVQYIGGLLKGALSVIDIPSEPILKKWTQWVYKNTPYTDKKESNTLGIAGNPIPRNLKEKSPIQYVFYIIKENRTYDQVLGDIKEGNGDTSLCIFPNTITPNQHALAKNFVLLDNFYVDAEVSADGHNWSTAAYANDYVEKTWPTSYGGRGGSYDYEGSRTIAYPKDGFIWDHLQREGISYRTYGEFAEYDKTYLPSLINHTCPKYPGFDLSIKDADKERIWEKEFDSLLSLGQLPHFNSIRLGNDHTSGTRRGAYSILAAVADNDQSVGQLIEHLAKSPIWNSSAVFILEDDAQAGSDHVDAHRSPLYVAGGFVKRNAVIHDLYTTSGVLRTIGLILGMKPMSQYDAGAVPLFNCFMNSALPSHFTTIPETYDTNTRNTAYNEGVRRSEMMNFAQEDLAPADELNEIIWNAVKGEGVKMPAPKHSAFVFSPKKLKDKKDLD